MFIWWGSHTRYRRLTSGHFACPVCRGRRPFTLLQREQVQTIFFFPLSSTPIDTLVRCDTCNHAFDTSVTAETIVAAAGGRVDDSWDCPMCSKSNPNNVFRCQSCGYSLV